MGTRGFYSNATVGGEGFTWFCSYFETGFGYSSTWTHKLYPFFGPFESVTVSL